MCCQGNEGQAQIKWEMYGWTGLAEIASLGEVMGVQRRSAVFLQKGMMWQLTFSGCTCNKCRAESNSTSGNRNLAFKRCTVSRFQFSVALLCGVELVNQEAPHLNLAPPQAA